MTTFSEVPDYYTPHTMTKPVIIIPDRPAQAQTGPDSAVTVVTEPATGALVLLAGVFIAARFMKRSKKVNRHIA